MKLRSGKSLISALIFLFYFITTPPLAKGVAIKGATGIGSPITAFSAETMDKGTWGLSQRSEYYRNQPFSNDTLISNLLAESQTGTYFNYLMLNYGLSNSLTLGASLPYMYTSNLKAGQENNLNIREVARLGNISGLSDLSFYALGQVLNNESSPILLSLILGLTVPTGKTNSLDTTSSLFSTSDQSGSGALSSINGLIFSKEWNSLEVSFNLTYTQNTKGSQQTILGSVWNYNLAAVYEFYKQEQKSRSLDGILELNGAIASEDTINGFKDVNSGGQSVFLLTGIRNNFNAVASIYLGLTLPLIERYHGAQLHTTYGLISGIDISLG